MRSITSRTRRSTVMVALGAAAAYFLDPDNGEVRRRDISGRLQRLLDRAPATPSEGPDVVTEPVSHDMESVRDADPTGDEVPMAPDAPESWTLDPPVGGPTPVVLW